MTTIPQPASAALESAERSESRLLREPAAFPCNNLDNSFSYRPFTIVFRVGQLVVAYPDMDAERNYRVTHEPTRRKIPGRPFVDGLLAIECALALEAEFGGRWPQSAEEGKARAAEFARVAVIVDEHLERQGGWA